VTGREVVRTLNLHGVAVRLSDAKVIATPAYRLTVELRALIVDNRQAVVDFLQLFGELNNVPPDAVGIPYRKWVESQRPEDTRKKEAV
jgi:hypothetical protein